MAAAPIYEKNTPSLEISFKSKIYDCSIRDSMSYKMCINDSINFSLCFLCLYQAQILGERLQVQVHWSSRLHVQVHWSSRLQVQVHRSSRLQVPVHWSSRLQVQVHWSCRLLWFKIVRISLKHFENINFRCFNWPRLVVLSKSFKKLSVI